MKEDHQSLSKHKHKRKKLSKKRCWICKSPFHFKKSCPKMRCYYCRRLGNIAANCRDKKIDFIYERLIEDLKRREEDKKERIERAIKKKEQRETELAIIKKRAEKLECELKKGPSGEVWMVKWNGIELGEYYGPGLLSPTISKFRQGEFNQKFIYYLVEKACSLSKFSNI